MPAVPLRHLIAQALLGDQESVASILLSDLYSSGGSRNLSIDKSGRVAQILGYTQQNVAPVTSNTGGVAERLRGLHHYVSQSSGSATRQEIGVFTDDDQHWEFRTSSDAGITWDFVHDYGAASADRIPDFAASGNLLFMTNGAIAPAQYDGTNLTTAGSTQLAAPTFTSTGAGELSGNIAWRILPMVGNTRKLSSVQSINYAVTAATGAGHVDWTADADVTVTGYEIYRTTGTGSIFFFEGSVVGRLTVTFNVGGTDDTDENLIVNRVLSEFGDPPPVGAYFCELHKQRMFYIRTDTNPRIAYYSDPGVPYSVYRAFNFVDFTDAESFTDVATGATGDFLSQFILWQERSVWTLSGDGEIIGVNRNFVRRKSDAQMGTVSHRTVTRIPQNAAYTDSEGNKKNTGGTTLAYLTPLADIRLFDGEHDEIISFPKRVTLQQANYSARRKSFVIHDHARQECTWVYASGVSTEPDMAVTWNYRWGTWYSRDWPFACGIEIETANSASVLLAGEGDLTIGGLCYLLWNGFTFNGAAIDSQWQTKVMYGVGAFGDAPGLIGKPLPSLRKRWRNVFLLFDIVGGSATCTVEWIPGDDPLDAAPALGSRTVTIPSSALETSDGSAILTSDGSPLFVQSLPALVKAQLQDNRGRHVHSRGLRLRVRLTTSTAQWFLSAMDTTYQVLAGEKRTVGSVV